MEDVADRNGIDIFRFRRVGVYPHHPLEIETHLAFTVGIQGRGREEKPVAPFLGGPDWKKPPAKREFQEFSLWRVVGLLSRKTELPILLDNLSGSEKMAQLEQIARDVAVRSPFPDLAS